MHMTNDQEGGKDLAPLNNEDQPRMNRGVELMMRNKNRRREEPSPEPKSKWFQFRLGQVITLFRREFHFGFEIYLDTNKGKFSKEE
jgi:hypothetical protein